jgi:hypothetical protein
VEAEAHTIIANPNCVTLGDWQMRASREAGSVTNSKTFEQKLGMK